MILAAAKSIIWYGKNQNQRLLIRIRSETNRRNAKHGDTKSDSRFCGWRV